MLQLARAPGLWPERLGYEQEVAQGRNYAG